MPVASKLKRRLRTTALASLGVAALVACASGTPLPDRLGRTPIDLPRYMGAWHVVAHVPYFVERGHVASIYAYTLQPDGDISVRYTYRTGFAQPLEVFDSRATVKDGSGNREWTTWFYRVIPTRYRILEVAPDYSWALVDYPGRDLAWVFGRTAVMDEVLYRDLLQRLRGHGVDTDKLWRVPQVRQQVGKLGFAEPQHP